MQVARFVPVVGQTAYAAHQTAKRALDGYDKAKVAAAQIRATGKASLAAVRDVARGKNIQTSIARLKQSANTPEARMLMQALQSMP